MFSFIIFKLIRKKIYEVYRELFDKIEYKKVFEYQMSKTKTKKFVLKISKYLQRFFYYENEM